MHSGRADDLHAGVHRFESHQRRSLQGADIVTYCNLCLQYSIDIGLVLFSKRCEVNEWYFFIYFFI